MICIAAPSPSLESLLKELEISLSGSTSSDSYVRMGRAGLFESESVETDEKHFGEKIV